MSSGDLIPRIYGNFRGVDFRGEEINLVRSPDSLNVYRDYKDTESIKTRPGLKLYYSFDSTIYGVFSYTENTEDKLNVILVHSGSKLYRVYKDEFNEIVKEIYEGLNQQKSSAFIFNNIFYFKDGKNFLEYEGITYEEDISGVTEKINIQSAAGGTAYTPTTTIGRKPSGGGTVHEDVNLLSSWRRNSFVGDGKSTDYYLDTTNLFEPQNAIQKLFPHMYATVDGKYKYSNYPALALNGELTVDYENGVVTFPSAPPAPATSGQDNVVITFLTDSDNSKKILGCTLQEVFDNRVFFGGNPDYPNRMWHSSLDNPTYVSDLDYYDEGVLDSSKITGLVAGNNALWVFKSPSQDNTTVFYHVPTIDYEYGKIYPSSHSSISTGCVGGAINFNDDIVFFSDKGMEGISGDVTTEQVIAHRSSLVDRKMITEEDYGNIILVEWEGYLVVIIGNKAYLADSRAMFTNENHYEYEWFYWEFEEKISAATVINGVMYLGSETGNLYALTDTEGDVKSYWTTPKDKFKYPQYQKTTNKRGCVVEATGDITVLVKTDKTNWEKIGDYKNITDYFVSRIKRKKFKDIQLKFSSDTRFTLETATLECFIGGYIKR